MRIRCAETKDVLHLKQLWKEAFFDDDEYIDFYFENRFDPNFVAVLTMNQEIAGMIHLLPCKIYPNERALYWYAACIGEKFRNKGYFRSFCEEIYAAARKMGYYNACKPAVGLEEFYRSIGFKYEYRALLTRGESSTKDGLKGRVGKTDANRLVLNQKEIGSLVWDSKAVEYAIKENELCRGISFEMEYDGKIQSAMAVMDGKKAKIVNSNFDKQSFSFCKSAIASFVGVSDLLLQIPDQFGEVAGLSDHPSVNSKSTLFFDLA